MSLGGLPAYREWVSKKEHKKRKEAYRDAERTLREAEHNFLTFVQIIKDLGSNLENLARFSDTPRTIALRQQFIKEYNKNFYRHKNFSSLLRAIQQKRTVAHIKLYGTHDYEDRHLLKDRKPIIEINLCVGRHLPAVYEPIKRIIDGINDKPHKEKRKHSKRNYQLRNLIISISFFYVANLITTKKFLKYLLRVATRVTLLQRYTIFYFTFSFSPHYVIVGTKRRYV